MSVAALLLGIGIGIPLRGFRSETSVLTPISVFFLLLGVLVLVLPLLFSPPVLRVTPDGIRAKRPMRREFEVPWSAVRGVRGATTLAGFGDGLLVVELYQEFFRTPGVRRWVPFGVYSNCLTMKLPLADIVEVLESFSPHVPTATPRLWANGTVRLAVSAGGMSLVCGLIISIALSVGVVSAPLPDHHEDAAPISQSPCGLVAPATLALLVPDGTYNPSVYHHVNGGGSGNDWACAVENVGQHNGYLMIDVARFAGLQHDSPMVVATKEFSYIKNVDHPQPNGRYLTVSGLGDEASGRVETDFENEFAAFIYVRRGSDIVSVQYRAVPTTSDLTLKAAVAVAQEILARLR
jgi:hypothetical protein